MTYTPLDEDPALDAALRTAVEAFAAMIGEVLQPYGLQESQPWGQEQITLDPLDGPIAVHVLVPVENGVERLDECHKRVHARLRSWYFLAPVQSEHAPALANGTEWLLRILRAQWANLSLDGAAEVCDPLTWSPVGEAKWGDNWFVCLVVISDLSVVVFAPDAD